MHWASTLGRVQAGGNSTTTEKGHPGRDALFCMKDKLQTRRV